MASNFTLPDAQPLLTLPTHHRASLAPFLPPNPLTSARPPPSLQNQPTATGRLPLPHLTLTYATSLDAQIALGPGVQTALSGPETKAMTHYLRSLHDAILIGANTALVDDPSLTCRHVGLENNSLPASQPVPVILDPSGKWGAPHGSKLLRQGREGVGRGLIWIVERGAVRARDLSDECGRVADAGGKFIVLGEEERTGDGGVDWALVLDALATRGFRSVMVEGGAKVIMDLLKERNRRFVSSVIITVAPVWLGQGGVVVCPLRQEMGKEMGRLEGVKWLPMGEDVVMAGNFGDGGR